MQDVNAKRLLVEMTVKQGLLITEGSKLVLSEKGKQL